jgi:hypothetical protein
MLSVRLFFQQLFLVNPGTVSRLHQRLFCEVCTSALRPAAMGSTWMQLQQELWPCSTFKAVDFVQNFGEGSDGVVLVAQQHLQQ